MRDTVRRDPPLPVIEDPMELDVDDTTVEPGETLVPTHIPEDPERGRMVDPEDREPMKAARRGSWGYALT